MSKDRIVVLSITLFLGVALAVVSCGDDEGTDPVEIDINQPLVVQHISPAEAPVIDGTVDAVWDGVKEFSFVMANTASGSSDLDLVRMRAMTDSTYFYWLVEWKDPERNIRPDFWTFDGPTPRSSGGQDFFMAIFDDGRNDTIGANCYLMCHDTDDDDEIADEMVNPGPGMIDVWLWTSGQSNPANTLEDLSYPADSGSRYDDVSANPAFLRNESSNQPRWVHKDWPDHPTEFLFADDTVTYNVSTMPDNIDSVPGYIIFEEGFFGGSKWDVDASGSYDRVAGRWTLEMRRELTTGNDDDIPFVLGQPLNVSFAVTNRPIFNTTYPHVGLDSTVAQTQLEF